jgi:transcriptional regulator with XRE-family HTH domain
MTFNDALIDSGFSPRQFAKLLGISRQAVYLWLAGDTVPSTEHQKTIHTILGMKVSFIKDNLNAEDNCLS